jgi:hypothetical protein
MAIACRRLFVIATYLAIFGTVEPSQAQVPPTVGADPPSATPSPAATEGFHEVVVLDPPRGLERALRRALSPWGMRVGSVVRAKPGATLPGSALDASSLARELGAKALVWMTANADGAALWLYIASKDAVTVRSVPDQPLNQVLAAALALSVKTWLLESDLAPKSATPVEPAGQDAPPVDDSVAAEGPPSVSVPLATPRAAPSLADEADDLPTWQLLVFAGARRGAFQQVSFDLRYGAEVRASPWSSESRTFRLWLALRGETGELQDIDNEQFRGVYAERGAGAFVGLSARLTSWMGAALYTGISLQNALISGTLLSDGIAARSRQWVSTVHAKPEMEFAAGPVGIVLQPALGIALATERYTADSAEAIRTSRVWFMLGAAAKISIF